MDVHEHRRRRWIAVVATVGASLVAMGIIALTRSASPFGLATSRTPTSTITEAVPPTAANVVEVDALPDSFPADLPIPDGVRPVAMYDGEAIVSVWFESDRGRGRSQRAFERMLSANGWVRIGGTGLGGIWDTHATSEGRTAIVLIRTNPGTQRLLHGSNAFEGDWDIFITMEPVP